MSVIYNFNEWKVSGEKATPISPKGYKLLRIRTGFKIGSILYHYYVKGFSVSQIKKTVARNLSLTNIRSVIKGFGKQASRESIEAYKVFMEMLKDEPETLDVIFGIK